MTLQSPSWFAVAWRDGQVVLLDQRRLPAEEVYLAYDTPEGVADAIRTMVVRGAPAIGIAAAMGVALAAREAKTVEGLQLLVEDAILKLGATRPTAVNLFWALHRMRARLQDELTGTPAEIQAALAAEAQAILEEDVMMCRAIGRHGADLIPDGARILTHCNAGALATGGYGTALGVIRAAVEAGKRVTVFADETRPYLQGARLTAWELQKDGIDVTVIADVAAGHLMSRGEIDCAIVGSDRTVANGDVANKIGTFGVAVLARHHGLPFYVALPSSTIDLSLPDGRAIPIEERPGDEVERCGGSRLVPAGVKVRNPAFDVTPAELVTAIITERGVARPPYAESLPALVG